MASPRHQEDSRLLYEQPQSKTLLFTTSLSTNLLQVDGSTTANTGIYQCTLEPDNNFDDFNDGDEHREVCHVASKLGDRLNFHWSRHGDLQLRNMQFDLSSLRSTGKSASKRNYLYANAHGKYEHSHHEPDWEIIRAELPQEGDVESEVLREDGTLSFHSVFRTIEELTWNECDFDCCVKKDKIYDEWDASVGEEFKQAFVRAFIRSFAVDEVGSESDFDVKLYFVSCVIVAENSLLTRFGATFTYSAYWRCIHFVGGIFQGLRKRLWIFEETPVDHWCFSTQDGRSFLCIVGRRR